MVTIILGNGSHGRMLWNLTGRVHNMIAVGDTLDPALVPPDAELIIGIGNVPRVGDAGMLSRMVLYNAYSLRVTGYDDPTSVMRGRSIHPSVQVFARAVINTDSDVMENCIINTGAVVEHDCYVGAHTHIAPGAILCGNVRVGNAVHVGAGAIVLQGRVIGDGAVVQAGAVVRRDVGAGETYLAPRA